MPPFVHGSRREERLGGGGEPARRVVPDAKGNERGDGRREVQEVDTTSTSLPFGVNLFAFRHVSPSSYRQALGGPFVVEPFAAGLIPLSKPHSVLLLDEHGTPRCSPPACFLHFFFFPFPFAAPPPPGALNLPL